MLVYNVWESSTILHKVCQNQNWRTENVFGFFRRKEKSANELNITLTIKVQIKVPL